MTDVRVTTPVSLTPSGGAVPLAVHSPAVGGMFSHSVIPAGPGFVALPAIPGVYEVRTFPGLAQFMTDHLSAKYVVARMFGGAVAVRVCPDPFFQHQRMLMAGEGAIICPGVFEVQGLRPFRVTMNGASSIYPASRTSVRYLGAEFHPHPIDAESGLDAAYRILTGLPGRTDEVFAIGDEGI